MWLLSEIKDSLPCNRWIFEEKPTNGILNHILNFKVHLENFLINQKVFHTHFMPAIVFVRTMCMHQQHKASQQVTFEATKGYHNSQTIKSLPESVSSLLFIKFCQTCHLLNSISSSLCRLFSNSIKHFFFQH